MKIEELLRPRYKVIADYPHNPWLVGEVLFVDDKGELVGETIGYVDYAYEIMENEVSNFPSCFRRIEWWEDRKVEDMPEYVSYVSLTQKEKLYPGFIGISDDGFYKARVFEKITKWDKWAGHWFDIGHQFNTHMHLPLPATEQEYLDYQKTQKPI